MVELLIVVEFARLFRVREITVHRQTLGVATSQRQVSAAQVARRRRARGVIKEDSRG